MSAKPRSSLLRSLAVLLTISVLAVVFAALFKDDVNDVGNEIRDIGDEIHDAGKKAVEKIKN